MWRAKCGFHRQSSRRARGRFNHWKYHTMKKVILLLQGGGSLGAFQCGAWKALAPFVASTGGKLSVVAGASIGAINAGMIAQHYGQPDSGVRILEALWRDRLATPSFPFFAPWNDYWGRWNALLTAMTFGNPSMFAPAYPNWNPAAARFVRPFYKTDRASALLEETFGDYRGDEPRLVISATDVKRGAAVLFDSAARTVTPRMIVASMSIPAIFPPTQIDGDYYWDGELRSSTLLPDVLSLLRQPSREASAAPERYLIVIVGMLEADGKHVPRTAMEVMYRHYNIVFGNKLRYEEQAVRAVNTHLRFVEGAAAVAVAADVPDSPLARVVRTEQQRLASEGCADVDILHVGRELLEHEHVSREFDYSPERIASLCEQGYDSAREAIERYLARDAAAGP
jgi:predicted acylesterase/phospholipase RssA